MLTRVSAQVPMPNPLPDGDYTEDFKSSGATFQLDGDSPEYGQFGSDPIAVEEAKVIDGTLVVSGWARMVIEG